MFLFTVIWTAGNDVRARDVSTTLWVSNPEETEYVCRCPVVIFPACLLPARSIGVCVLLWLRVRLGTLPTDVCAQPVRCGCPGRHVSVCVCCLCLCAAG